MTANIIDHMKHLIKIRERIFDKNKPDHIKYACIEDFVLKHGHYFQDVLDPIPRKYKYGPLKLCYKNAYQAALMSGGELIYCEGFAFSILIPVLHAWCIDLKGNVIDVTWDRSKFTSINPEDKFEYYGIPFALDFVWDQMSKSKHYGILDCWELDFSHIRGHWDDLPFIDPRWPELKRKLEERSPSFK